MKRLVGAVLAALATIGCGKQGPPLPPLHLVPQPVQDVTVRRTDNEVRFTFVLPTRNVNGPGQVNIDRVELYAATIAPGAAAPPNRELLTSKHVVATLPVRQPVKEGAPATPATQPAETGPGPGEPAFVVDVLNEAKLTPQYTTPVPSAPVPPTSTTTPAATPELTVAKRIYAIRGISRSGRPGQPTTRFELPLVELPPPPTAVSANYSETAITVSWLPPVTDATTKLAFNVYPQDGLTPLNPKPLGELTLVREGVEFGTEECFVVRTVSASGAVSIESAASAPACAAPADVFPPAAPQRLTAVATGPGLISLIWDANTEADLEGYVVLRGTVPGDKLQALTTAPIKETRFRDTTVTTGVRYVYAVVAVDTAKPPNTSPQSNRVEETAR